MYGDQSAEFVCQYWGFEGEYTGELDWATGATRKQKTGVGLISNWQRFYITEISLLKCTSICFYLFIYSDSTLGYWQRFWIIMFWTSVF